MQPRFIILWIFRSWKLINGYHLILELMDDVKVALMLGGGRIAKTMKQKGLQCEDGAEWRRWFSLRYISWSLCLKLIKGLFIMNDNINHFFEISWNLLNMHFLMLYLLTKYILFFSFLNYMKHVNFLKNYIYIYFFKQVWYVFVLDLPKTKFRK